MKRIAIAVLLLFCCQTVLSPAQPAASQPVAWTPGLYLGWVYFLERSDYQYNVSQNGVTVEQTTVLYQESHGEIECNVHDITGNGACSGSFPMEKISGTAGTLTSTDCYATWTESTHAPATSELVPIAPLVYSPLTGGFSTLFTPESGQSYANFNLQASGANPACRSMTITANVDIGIPQWPNLDYIINYHTDLTAGGICNMKTFPRDLTIGHATTTAKIVQCEWRMFFFDPYAKLP
jgi:hypothetical protein